MLAGHGKTSTFTAAGKGLDLCTLFFVVGLLSLSS